jgi:predicted transcriptional regulator
MDKKRKRAPGAGRPRKAETDKKGATFTTRISWETRRGLDEAAKKHKRSVSLEAEVALRHYLKKPEGAPRNRALASIVANLAEGIEAQTGKSWRTDIFTSMAVRYAIEAVLFHFAPGTTEAPAIPEAVERQAEKMPPEFAERYRKPAGFGYMRAHHLITEIESRPRPGKMVDEWTLPIGLNASLEMLDIIARDLDLE